MRTGCGFDNMRVWTSTAETGLENLQLGDVSIQGNIGDGNRGVRAEHFDDKSYCCTGIQCSEQPEVGRVLEQCDTQTRNVVMPGSRVDVASYVDILSKRTSWAQDPNAAAAGAWATAYGGAQDQYARLVHDGDLTTTWQTAMPLSEKPSPWIQLDLLKSQRVGTINVIFGTDAASNYAISGDEQGSPWNLKQLAKHVDERCSAGRADRHFVLTRLRIIRIDLHLSCGDSLEIAEIEVMPAETPECRLPRGCVVGMAEAIRVAGGVAGVVSNTACETAWQEATEQVAITDACAGVDVDQDGPANAQAFTSASFINCRYEVFNAFPSYYLCSPPV
jgi:hypothetical protein